LEAVVGLGAAIDYLEYLGWKEICEQEKKLTEYALKKLAKIPEIKIYGSKNGENRLGVISFSLGKIHAHDVGEILNRFGVCVRAGHHCAQPLMKVLGATATVRASLYIYNSKEDIDKLLRGLAEVRKVFSNG
jgi:cysteine desulfurase / selenocysteine lyase